MAKKFRNAIVPLMALSLVLGLAACGNSKDTDAQQTESGAERIENQESGGQETERTKPGTEQENKADGGEGQTAGKDTLVIYFSATGTTKGVAEKIADITDADIYEIIPAEIYSSEDLDYGDSSSRSSVEMDDPDARPEIGSETISLEGYSTVYLGYPIWWGEAPRIMSTFVESYDFDGITVIPFCTSGGSGIGRSGDSLAGQAGNGTWLSGERFGGSVSESEIQEWIEGLQ